MNEKRKQKRLDDDELTVEDMVVDEIPPQDLEEAAGGAESLIGIQSAQCHCTG